MEQKILFTQKDPKDFKDEIVNDLKKVLELLKKDFQPKEAEEYLTRQEAAERLKINLSTLWAWTKKGILAAYGVQGRVYYKSSDIADLMQPLKSK